MKQPIYTWDIETGEATCILKYKHLEFVGKAFCHEEDRDMMSKLMGQTIAEARALIAYLKHVRDNEIKPQLHALRKAYNTMNQSKWFRTTSYEAKILRGQIAHAEKELEQVKQEIANTRVYLRDYIDQKLDCHKNIRDFREKKQKLVEPNE